jgi:DNA-binding NtrC family response regulator
MRTILCIDDEATMTASVRAIFEGTHKVFISNDVPQAREILKSERVDLILLDYALPGMNGLAFLDELTRVHSEIPVLMVTAFDAEYTLAEALKRGARGRISKPFNVSEIRHHVNQALASLDAPKMRAALEKQSNAINPSLIAEIISSQKAITKAADLMRLHLPIFIEGERGVGKELVARHLHQVHGRSPDLFYLVRCGDTAQDLEQELFGTESEPGIISTMTGIVFFDEAHRLPHSVKLRLGEIIAAKALPKAPLLIFGVSSMKSFLDGMPSEIAELEKSRTVQIPPLRDHPDDIPVLAYRLLVDLGKRFNNPLLSFSTEAVRCMRAYPWPGNVRELQNVVERLAMIYGEHPEVEASFLPREICPLPSRIPKLPGITMDQTIESVEKGMILDALDKTGGNAAKAAELLETTPRRITLRVTAFKQKAEDGAKTETP